MTRAEIDRAINTLRDEIRRGEAQLNDGGLSRTERERLIKVLGVWYDRLNDLIDQREQATKGAQS